MPEEIDIPKVPLSRTEQYLTKIVKELSGSEEEVEIPKTTLSRVEIYLKAIIDLLAEAAVKKPITVKGTVDSYNNLPEDAVTGDLYFVKNNKESSKTDEYIKTDTGWDRVGDTGVDLTNYVKKTDWSTNTRAGIVATPTGAGLCNVGGPQIGIYHPTDDEITSEHVAHEHTALTLDRIPDVVNYYVDGKSLEMDADTHTVQIHHPDTSEIEDGTDLEHQALTLDRISDMFNYFGIDDRTTLDDDYVKNSDYATLNLAGAVKVANDTDISSDGVLVSKHTGIHIENNGTIGLTNTTEQDVIDEKEGRLALHPQNIPQMMKQYGLTSKDYLQNKLNTFVNEASVTNLVKQNAYSKVTQVFFNSGFTNGQQWMCTTPNVILIGCIRIDNVGTDSQHYVIPHLSDYNTSILGNGNVLTAYNLCIYDVSTGKRSELSGYTGKTTLYFVYIPLNNLNSGL